MLNETIASEVYAKPPCIPGFLLEENGLDEFINDLQGDLTLHGEADDIAAYVVDAPGISYSEALVTLASDPSMSKPIGHSVLVPLRVFRLLSSRRPTELTEYSLAFEYGHLENVSDFITLCIEFSKPPSVFFTSDEHAPWEGLLNTCAELITSISEESASFSNDDSSYGSSLEDESEEEEEKSSESFAGRLIRQLFDFFRVLLSIFICALCCCLPLCFCFLSRAKKKVMPHCAPCLPVSSMRTSDEYFAPRRFDVIRRQDVMYRRGYELMHASARDSNVYLKSQPLPKRAVDVLTKYTLHLGPLKKVGVERAANEDVGGDNGIPGLNELIDDINNGIQKPARWLLSHVLCGRVSGGDGEGSKTSWFPQRSPNGEHVHESLSLHQITRNVGPLLRSSEGITVLPMLGCGKVGTLSMLTTKSGRNAQVQAEWRDILFDEEFELATDHGWEVARTELC